MKVDGRIMDIMVKDHINLMMVVSIMGNGKIIKNMEKEYIFIQMAIVIKANLKEA